MDFTQQELFILRRANSRLPLEGFPITERVKAMLQQYDLKDDAGYVRYSQFIAEDPALLVAVMRIDPLTPPVAAPERSTPPEVYVPPLPEAAQLSGAAIQAGERVGEWYRVTSKWLASRSPMTPPHFLEAATLWLAGLAIAKRVVIDLHERISPHLYLLIVAETSRYAKSTGMGLIYQLVMATMPYMIIPGTATSEALVEIMSGQTPANYDKLSQTQKARIEAGRKFAGQRGIILDEFSGLLGSSKKDYMQGFVELLMRLYDGRSEETYQTKAGGLITINQPALSIFGATTPAAMARALNNEAWENGEMARYLIMFREDVLPYSDDYGRLEMPPEVTKPLLVMHDALPRMRTDFAEDADFKPITALFADDALNAYRQYARAVRYDMLQDCDNRLTGNYTRLHIQALKIALSLATVDYLSAGERFVRIELGHWSLAQQITERSRENLHRLLLTLSESRDSRNQRDILTLLRQHPGGLTVRDFCRRMTAYANDIRGGLEILLDSGEVIEIEHTPNVGRPTKVYRAADKTVLH
jgi:hypothetical protein